MRAVTGYASFDFGRRMLKDKRPSLLDVACYAGFPSGFAQHGVIHGAVRIVTIRAFHEPFGHTVMCGKGKLRLDGTVTIEAEIRLRLF